jgi:hypothetical protein
LQQIRPPPANPGATATIVGGMVAAQIRGMNQVHTKVTCLYRTYHNVDQAFKKMIIDDFEDPFLNALSDEIVGYTNCISLQFISRLLTHYAMIALTELTHNNERLNMAYDPNQLIETLFQKIQDACAFVVAGGHPYDNVMITNVDFTLVFNTRLFPDDCRTWQARTVVGQTWVQFKIYSTSVHREFRLTNQTVHQYGFHSANVMIEQGREETMQYIVDTIVKLATSTASDPGTVATLTVTNAKLDVQLETSQAYIKKLKEEISDLKANITPARQGQRPAKSKINDNYCWCHGCQVHKDHTSATCKVKKDGHKDAGTKDNPVGGVKWGK